MSDVMESSLARLLILSANGSYEAQLNILNGCRAS